MISLLIPTRNRPSSMQRIAESALNLAKNPDQIEIVFYIDYDDSASVEMAKKMAAPNIKYFIGPRVYLSVAWNILASQHATHPILSPLGDDAIFRTQDWDTSIIAQFDAIPDKIALVYARDGIQNEKVATQAFIHQNWVKTVGYCLPPYFFSDFTDLWLTEIAKKIKRKIYLPDVYIEHIHPASGKTEADQTHLERLARLDKQGWKLYKKLAFLRKEQAKKLQEFIKNHKNTH